MNQYKDHKHNYIIEQYSLLILQFHYKHSQAETWDLTATIIFVPILFQIIYFFLPKPITYLCITELMIKIFLASTPLHFFIFSIYRLTNLVSQLCSSAMFISPRKIFVTMQDRKFETTLSLVSCLPFWSANLKKANSKKE